MADLAEVNFYLSGGSIGAGNTDLTKSTGGVITTTKILNQLATVSGAAISGLTLGDAQGNAIGTGTITYAIAGAVKTLRWTPPLGSIGATVDVSAGGTFALQGGNNGGVVNVTIVSASLPGTGTTESVVIDWQRLKILPGISKAQALAGLVDYHCIYCKNDGAVAVTDDKVNFGFYIETNTPGADVISIGLATQAPGTGTGVSGTDYPADTTSESIAPAGVTFTSPTAATPLAAFNLSSTAGATFTKAIWIKREVPAGTDNKYVDDNFTLAFAVAV
jgi:hypothetical protein